MTTQETIVTIRAKAFDGHGIETVQVLVPADSVLPLTQAVVRQNVRVYDAVAGYYTSCHSLSKSAIRRARRLAECQ